MHKIKMLSIGAVMAGATIMISSTSATAASGVWTSNAARNEIIRRESGGNPYAVNPTSGARGLYQCLPATNACPGSDVASQHAWGQSYMNQRYGSWEKALAFHNANHWW